MLQRERRGGLGTGPAAGATHGADWIFTPVDQVNRRSGRKLEIQVYAKHIQRP